MTFMGLPRPASGIAGRAMGMALAQVQMLPIQVRQAGSGATMALPQSGSVIVVYTGNASNATGAVTISGGGVTTWTQAASTTTQSGAGSIQAAMAWGVVGNSPSTTLSASFAAGGASTAYAWIELRGLAGVQRFGGSCGGAGTTPSRGTVTAITTPYAGSFIIAGQMSQDTITAVNSLTQAVSAAQGARNVWLGYGLMSFPAGGSSSITFHCNGANSKLAAAAMLIG